MEEYWEARLQDLYRELDVELERLASVCDGCGECCRFDRADHVLYASSLERRLLALAPMPDKADGPADLLAAGLRCPFQAGNGCRARGWRTLGCRLHFCRWPETCDENDFAERWHARLKRLHDEVGEAWDYRRLLPLR